MLRVTNGLGLRSSLCKPAGAVIPRQGPNDNDNVVELDICAERIAHYFFFLTEWIAHY
jgi:hypothetical protein